MKLTATIDSWENLYRTKPCAYWPSTLRYCASVLGKQSGASISNTDPVCSMPFAAGCTTYSLAAHRGILSTCWRGPAGLGDRITCQMPDISMCLASRRAPCAVIVCGRVQDIPTLHVPPPGIFSHGYRCLNAKNS